MNRSEAIIVTIGDELLIGQVVDTNSAWIGQQFAEIGMKVRRIITIADDKSAIKEAVTLAMSEVELVLLTGGLGPTKDDITKATLCELFGGRLIFNQQVYDNVESLLLKRIGSINHLNKSQAYVPDNAEIFNNEVGTAPIMKFEKNERVLFSMPGVPFEMKYAVKNFVIPYIKKRYETGHFLSQTVSAVNIAESVLAEKLESWEGMFPSNLSLAYLPSPGLIKLRLTWTNAVKDEEAETKLNGYVEELKERLGSHFLAYGDASPEEILGKLLMEKGLSIGTAESCTGGLIAHKISTIPGCSSYYKGSVVAYSNDVKHNVLDVDLTSIEHFGAVSQEVVEQMALGVRRVLGCDVGIATSGIAGPSGGTEEKPVGTVWIAWAFKEKVLSKMYTFGKLRNVNIERSAKMALIQLINVIKKEYSENNIKIM